MAIRFFNTKALATELAKNQINEKDTFQYFLANSLLLTVSLYYDLLFGAIVNWMYLLEIVVVLLITVHGLLKAFGMNGGENGTDFVVRATCLSFPIWFKLTVVSAVLGLVVAYFSPFIFDPGSFRNPEKIDALITFIWAPAFTAIYFWRLTVHLEKINS